MSEDVMAAVLVLVVSTLALFLVALIAAASFTVIAHRRLPQLGMMSAIGATEKHLRLTMLASGAVTGSLAAVGGRSDRHHGLDHRRAAHGIRRRLPHRPVQPAVGGGHGHHAARGRRGDGFRLVAGANGVTDPHRARPVRSSTAARGAAPLGGTRRHAPRRRRRLPRDRWARQERDHADGARHHLRRDPRRGRRRAPGEPARRPGAGRSSPAAHRSPNAWRCAISAAIAPGRRPRSPRWHSRSDCPSSSWPPRRPPRTNSVPAIFRPTRSSCSRLDSMVRSSPHPAAIASLQAGVDAIADALSDPTVLRLDGAVNPNARPDPNVDAVPGISIARKHGDEAGPTSGSSSSPPPNCSTTTACPRTPLTTRGS